MPDRETAHLIRGIVTRGVIGSTDDSGEQQTATTTQWKDVGHKDVEVLQAFGVASRAPSGGLGLVLAVGGDQGDLVMLPIGAPGVRLGKLEEGEAALYGLDGSRVHVKADGSIHITTTRAVTIERDGRTLEVQDGFIRGKMPDGSRFAAGPGWAKIAAGGHHVAVGSSGITVSVPPVVGADPAPDV